jgi:ubiquinone/menaquinone biosynthesis C-methylase UbiE
MKEETAKKLIDKTKDDYNLIAEQFASTRKFNWPDIAAAVVQLGEISEDSNILDIGCGAGRVSELFPKACKYTGLDLSDKLIDIAIKNFPNRTFLVGDATNLPFEDCIYDFTLSIATIHHIPSKKLRDKSIREMFRTTKPGGKILISVWYFWNRKNLKYMFVKSGRRFGIKDFYMPWKRANGTQKTERYFHAWTKNELHRALLKQGFTDIHFHVAERKQKWNLIVTGLKPRNR